jgi:hypothetical protein
MQKAVQITQAITVTTLNALHHALPVSFPAFNAAWAVLALAGRVRRSNLPDTKTSAQSPTKHRAPTN